MTNSSEFPELFQRARAGDQAACAEMHRRLGPAVHKAARRALFNPGLRRLVDPSDVCQSVWMDFFLRGLGKVKQTKTTVEQPKTTAELRKILMKSVRRKVFDQLRRNTAQRRDQGRVEAGDVGGREVADAVPTPSEQVVANELLQAATAQLSPEEARLHELRAEGLAWSSVATRVGATPEAARKKLERAIGRLRDHLRVAI